MFFKASTRQLPNIKFIEEPLTARPESDSFYTFI
jgi:hypothetical protein